jgi:hypothetical protein
VQIEFTVTGLKPTRRVKKPRRRSRPSGSAVRTLVLAYQIERAVREGRAHNYAEVARQAGLTRARISQVLRLLQLPPPVIERLLLTDPEAGAAITERQLRPLIGAADALARWNELECERFTVAFDRST